MLIRLVADFREREPQILDYRTQQYKLFPALATCLAMKFSATWLWDMYNSVTSELEQGDLERLPEVSLLHCHVIIHQRSQKSLISISVYW